MRDEYNAASFRGQAAEIYYGGLQVVSAKNLLGKRASFKNGVLSFLDISGKETSVDTANYRRIKVFGAGKHAASYAKEIETLLGDAIDSGIVVTRQGFAVPTSKISIIEAGHPLPDEAGAQAAEQIIAELTAADEEDLIIALFGGGASALLPAPVSGVLLEEKVRLTDFLLKSGATIHELNIIRKHISRLKGGNFSAHAYPAAVVSLLLSDVFDDDLETIASGVTSADSSTFQQALDILNYFHAPSSDYPSIYKHLLAGAQGSIEETPRNGDERLSATANVLLGNNRLALQAMKRKAEELGMNTFIISDIITGEAREAAQYLWTRAKAVYDTFFIDEKPLCILSGGETTVTVTGSGTGGRNMELALAMLPYIAKESYAVFLSAGTDGNDGSTDAAGALVDALSFQDAAQLKLDPIAFLENNDSYTFLKQINRLFITGPSFTNVADVQMFIFYLG